VPLTAWLERERQKLRERRDAQGVHSLAVSGAAGGPEEPDLETLTQHFSTACTWGLYSLLKALLFVGVDCGLVHGNLSTDAVWVTRGGDWKLSGFELTSDGKASAATPFAAFLRDFDPHGPCPEPFKAPERAAKDWAAVAQGPALAVDAFSLAYLVCEVYAGGKDNNGSMGMYSASSMSAFASGAPLVPLPLRPILARMLAALPTSRLPPARLLDADTFKHPVVGLLLFLDELALKEPAEKQRFFKSLPQVLPQVPASIAMYRILPALMAALEYGAAGGGGTVVLAPILDIGARLPLEEYSRDIVPCVVRLFASTDRATRVQLLHYLPSYIDKLSADVVNGTVLPHVVNGFADTNAVLREATVKACLPLAAKVTQANLTDVLLKALRRTLADPEPAIRVNTTICIGRMAPLVQDALQREENVLPCFLRETRDPFPHARVAALKAIAYLMSLPTTAGNNTPASANTPSAAAGGGSGGSEYYWSADCLSRKVLAHVALSLTDPYPDAREAAFLLFETSLRMLKAVSDARAVGDRERERQAAAAAATASAQASGGVHSGVGSMGGAGVGGVAQAGGAAGGSRVAGKAADLLGWAVSSLAQKILPTGEMGQYDPTQPQQPQQAQQQAVQSQYAPPAAVAAAPAAVPRRPTAGSIGQSAAASIPAAAPASATARAAASSDVDVGDGWGDNDWDSLAAPAAPAKPSARLAVPAANGRSLGAKSMSTSASSAGANDLLDFGASSAAPPKSELRLGSRKGSSGGAAASDGWDWDSPEPLSSAPAAPVKSSSLGAAAVKKTDTAMKTASSNPIDPFADLGLTGSVAPATKLAKPMKLGAVAKAASASGPKPSADGWDEW
jgi:SCY1-like protein 1